jgi:undecaprenyl-diphosphatase
MMSTIFSSMDKWDHAVFFAFQRIQSSTLDVVLGYPTLLGDTFLLLSVLLVGILFLDRDKVAEKITLCVFAVLTTYWVVTLLKDFFGRPRPWELWPGVALTFGKAANPAFPSGHTAVAFAAAYTLNRIYPGKMSWLYAVAGWVGITRIYTGVHYPTDVLAGAVVGIACAIVATALFNKRTAWCDAGS